MPKRILLADDSITIQKVVELTFSDGDYEVTAVNNGAKAIQKLSEMRPDIVLSDIIMPEKNGYEVCEYVKSHPELRHLPVILLTGTFEPFDPDRAEKAGCDAVVTKPFESQSLVHRVEELIAASQQAAPAQASPAPSAEPSPWMDEPAPEPGAGIATSGQDLPAPEPFTHDNDIFGAPPQEPAPSMEVEPAVEESPFAPPDSGETRAFPRMTFDQLQQMAESSTSPAGESLPWDQSTAAFTAPPPPEEPSEEPSAPPIEMLESPFGAPPPPEDFSGETRAFPKMSFEDLQQMESRESEPPPPAAAEPAPEASPWSDEAPAFGGETRAFPKMSFEELAGTSSSTPEPPPAPWLEPQEPAAPAFGATPDLEQPAPETQEPEPEPLPWDTTPSWSGPEAAGESESFSTAAEPVSEDLPFAQETTPQPAPEPEEPSWSPAAASAAAEEAEPAVPQTVIAPEPAAVAAASSPAELTDAQIDRIARRVVELMSEQVVRNIAWEVIPDMAEMVVKERIRQLESEA